MKLLHTSDWHIGRTFHTHSTLGHVRTVLDALVEEVRSRDIDVVLVAGDVFDSAMPSADAYRVLSDVLRGIRAAGARVVVTSGNHDSATRLGFQAEWAGEAGVHVLTRHEDLDRPVLLHDEHGEVAVYGIPFLEPALVRHHYPDHDLSTHTAALEFAMARVRHDLSERTGVRSVVLSHCFAAGVAASDVERDITAGGIDLVPASVFDGPDYVALGHIHGRSTISDRVRYSGAPLHYSFAEAGKPRGGWLVTLDATGLESVEWLDLPVPRPVAEITGDLATLVSDPALAEHEQHWVKAILTDPSRPFDAMRALQSRFEHCVALEHRPPERSDDDGGRYTERMLAKSDRQIVAEFVEFVRGGVVLSPAESDVVSGALREIEGEQVPS